MRNIFIDFLPPWVETGLQPAFYDKESGTVLQQTARMYAKINELIASYNSFTENITNQQNDFEQRIDDTVDEYIEKFIALKDFVDNYFDNLDVQEEINNKLDDMVEAGTLQEIITTYIQSNVAWTFDTVADMKLATNLVDGSYARTLGFHTINDGGGALYKITNSGTANEMDVIAIGDLRASLITGEHTNVMQFGAYGDNTNDDSTVLQYVLTNFDDVYIPDKLYSYATTLEFTRSNQIVRCDGNLRYSGTGSAIQFVSGVDSNIFIRKINSNGVGVLVQPSNSCGRNRLEITLIDSTKEAFKVTGQYSTSSWYLYGLRWNSISDYAVNFEIPADSTGIYYSRFLFNDMALLAHASDTKGIILNNIGGLSIEVEFNHVNLENAKGIRTSGNVGYLTINECRITEIVGTDWLEFNNYIPNTRIATSGRVEMEHIKFNNITGGEQVFIDGRARYSSYDYIGARIMRTTSGVAPIILANGAGHTTYEANSETNTIGDNIVDNTIAFIPPTQVRITNATATTELNVPNYIYNNINQLIVNVVSSTTSVTVKYGTRTLGQTLAGGKKYILYNIGNFVWATEIA